MPARPCPIIDTLVPPATGPNTGSICIMAVQTEKDLLMRIVKVEMLNKVELEYEYV